MNNRISKILLVDDNRNDIELSKHYLSKHFKETIFITANNEEEFFSKLESTEPDIIISDFDMPICNGLDLLFSVRQKYSTPFIFLTGTLNSGDAISKTILGGANAYLFKENIKSLPQIVEDVHQSSLRKIEANKIKKAQVTQLKLRVSKLNAIVTSASPEDLKKLAGEIADLVEKL